MRVGFRAVLAVVLAVPVLAQRPAPERPQTGAERPVFRNLYGIGFPREPLFVGSWHRLPVALHGLKLDQVEFVVVEGARGGFVSPSLDETFDPEQPTVLFAAGWEPGIYRLEMRRRDNQQRLVSEKYEISRERQGLDGPSIWLQGRTNEPSRGVNGSAWGGGPPGVQIQNYAFQPAPAVWHVAAILIDTADQRYTAGEATATRTTWQEEAVDGSTGAEPGRSVVRYYREASYGKTTIEFEFFGPFSLDGVWTDYFRDGAETNGPNFAGMWFAKPEFHQAVGSLAQGAVDFEQFDSVLSIVRSVDAEQFAWPLAQVATFPQRTGWFGATVFRRTVAMPHDWGSGVRPARRIHETLAHELGHNLGLPDLYVPDLGVRNVGGWDLMHRDSVYPYFSLGHRLLLGWVPPDWIKPLNFSLLPVGQSVNEPAFLSPAASGEPPANHHVGVEIRIGNGHNYYLEYRRAQPGLSGDQELPVNDRLLLSDMISADFLLPPAQRPAIILARPDAGDGPILGTGETYHQQETDPLQALDLKVEAVEVADNHAEVWLRYELHNPDPSIRAWPASAERPYQSPDIVVRNDRSDADPSWFNCPWEDHNNTIEATIHNDSMADAPQVSVDFYEQSFNLGILPGERRLLGTVTSDIGHGDAVVFRQPWVPADTSHKCIEVSLRPYTVPGSTVLESSPLNNFAQSNYTRFISASASPPSRERSFVAVSNPYPEPTFFLLDSQQTNPLYRTYLSHTYVYLQPKETRQVEVMSEYAEQAISESAAAAGEAADFRKIRPVWDDQPNLVHLRGWIVEPRDPHVLHPFGGVDIAVTTGKATHFDDLKLANSGVTGRVLDSLGSAVPGGQVLATLRSGTGKSATSTVLRTTVSRGTFHFEFKTPWQALELYFAPPVGYGDAQTVLRPPR